MGRGLWSVKALNHLQRSRRNRSGAGGYRHQLMAGFLAAPAEGPARHAHHKIAAPTTISTVVMSTRYSTAPRARRSAFSAKSGGFRPRAWRDCYLDTSNKQTRSDTYLHVAPGRCTQSSRGRGSGFVRSVPVPASYNVHPEFGFLCPTPRLHRRVRLVLAGLVFAGLCVGVLVATYSSRQEMTTNRVDAPPVAVTMPAIILASPQARRRRRQVGLRQ
jgi:hypothetical protein